MIKNLVVSLWRLIFGEPKIEVGSAPFGYEIENEILFRKFDPVYPQAPPIVVVSSKITIEAREQTLISPKGLNQDPRYYARLFKKFEL